MQGLDEVKYLPNFRAYLVLRRSRPDWAQFRRYDHDDNAEASADEPKVKANDKAYNAALRNLPDKQFDPWRGVR